MAAVKRHILPALLGTLLLWAPTMLWGADTPDPTTVTVAGSLQSELGCPGDWQPECADTHLAFDAGDGVWQGVFSVPAGTWEYKAALNDTWDENYGANAVRDGANIPLGLTAPRDVKFYYDHESHWVTDNASSVIATVAGDFQSELGCPGDWQPDCLRSWLQDADGDGIYVFATDQIPAGNYELKVALDEGWAESYPGSNVPFAAAAGTTITFTYDSTTHDVSVDTGGGNAEPGDELLVREPVRVAAQDDFVYFVLPDRFANGDPGNDSGGDSSGNPLVNGYLPTDKGYYHGGDIAGLMGKLDYLQGLGVTALWITPPFTNRAVQGNGTVGGSSAGYHGYWIVDFTHVDPHLGSDQELKDLVAAAHARSMKVFLDIVVNHTADVITYEEGVFSYRNKDDFPYRDATGNPFDDRDFVDSATFPPLDPATSFPYTPVFAQPEDATAKSPAWLNDPLYYHNRGNSTSTGENAQYGDFFGLDDLWTERKEVVDGMIDIYQNAITEFGVDGFRVDTVKHVNDELWQRFVPEIRSHAAAQGNPEFVVFGEVADPDAAFRSRYTTALPFPSTLDFGFDAATKDFASRGGASDGLRAFFAADDYFTDGDSNAYSLATFIGNHDSGRLGRDIDVANPGADDAERVARAKLAHALMFFSRGMPVIYYGDEQGFVGDGGDKDARQDMLPSQVASYNDDDLIGTAATTADDNFDPSHPLYQAFGDFAALRDAHPALRQGAQLHRYSEGTPGIYAFSRIDRGEQVEYLVALNNSEAADTAAVPTSSPSTTFTNLYPGGATALASDGSGNVTVDVPALDLVVYRAGAAVPPSAIAPTIDITTPAEGSTVTGRFEVGATVPTNRLVEVTFAVSVDGGAYEPIGTDDNAPYRVFFDVGDLPGGTALEFKAIANDLSGHISSDKVAAVVASEPVPPAFDYAIIHYLRPAGDYGTPSADYNSFWGLHLWGDAIDPSEVTEWTQPKPFEGEDEYGRFAWIRRGGTGSQVNFIIHQGDAKDTDPDRGFDADAHPEVWIHQGDETIYTSQAEAQGFVIVHYHRDDGDYGDPTSPDYNDFWGLHLWGDAIDPSEGTGWTDPKRPTGFDSYGAFWEVQIVDASQPVNFIVHRGDQKDTDPDQSFNPSEDATVWIMSGDETIYPSRGAALGFVTIHYHRDDGDYGDPTSSDFNDFWGLHVWTGALNPNPSWQEPIKPVGQDQYGLIFEIPLAPGATELAYIIHRGDTKDPGPDQFLDLATYGYEVWQLSGEDPSNPDEPHYILPILGVAVPGGDIDLQHAHWVSLDTIAWAAGGDPSADYALCHAPAGGMTLGAGGIEGGTCIDLGLGAPYPAGVDGFRHLAGMPTLTIPAGFLGDVPSILTGQIAVQKIKSGIPVDASGLQIPGVLDDLYATDVPLGVVWNGPTPTLRLWAPTAKSVMLHLFDDADPATTPVTGPMAWDAATGTWSVSGDGSWKGKYYLYEVEVYVPSTGAVEPNLVTDPYSLSLAMNSTRSQVVDLTDPALAPAGWEALAKPPLDAPEDISVYEIHVRDFSINDPSVPDELKGTYKAFTLPNTNGMDHLQALADAGLTHLHLLPAFDIATIDEDKASWQQPDPMALATYPPDSDEQQGAVAATADLDGFNWGYDPFHYTTPEGSYATDPDGATRIVEFREMVQSLNNGGLRVVMDVVYNHTHASGQSERSVLDRIVPGYYHRLDDTGAVATSTCCANTATEHAMMERLMVDSLVTWARDYKVDGFRFDLMGHHSLANMLEVRAALDALTVADDGVDGSSIYLYGEGWNFGEVADNARFVQATQLNMGGTGIGTFNDRLRDAVRGGGSFDSGTSLIANQGFINGLVYDPNAVALPPSVAEAEMLLSADQIRVGLAGNLAAYELEAADGTVRRGDQIDYLGSPAGYTQDPQEDITYISAHDNQTLYDINAYKAPLATGMMERVRIQNLGLSTVLLGQGVPFIHAGSDLLRSKSFDRDSFNSGDWFNTLDFTYQANNFGVGLPVASANQDNWPIMQPLLADPGLKPQMDDIVLSASIFQDFLQIRYSSPLFRLVSAQDVQDRVRFHNTGPGQVPGLIVMSLSDTVEPDLDPDHESVVVLFNANDEPQTFAGGGASPFAGLHLNLHPVQAASIDPVVRTATFDKATGTFVIPGRTTAVFVEQEILPGDLDGDGDVDRDDLTILLAARNTPASGPDDPADLDGDGVITVLDARHLILLCTRDRCATE